MSDYNLEYQKKYTTSIREQEEKEQEERSKKIEKIKEQEILQRKYENFCESVIKFFLEEGISYFAKKSISLNESLTDKDTVYDTCRSIIKRYINENDHYNIINRMQEKTQLLSEMCSIIDKHVKLAKESVDINNELSFYIKESNTREFYKSLSELNGDKVSEKINKRVVDATDDFVQNNVNDKLDMEETAEKIKEKSDKYKNNDEEIQKEFVNIYKRNILDKQNSRPKNILEQLINENAKCIIKDNDLRTRFSENNKIDFNSIKEFSIGIYYGLETLNTMRIQEMTKDLAKELIDNIN